MTSKIRIGLLALSIAPCVLLTPAVGAADEVAVTQKDKAFQPASITLKSGDVIVFKNDDPITHNMFSRSDGFEFNLKMQKPGQDLRQSFDKPGQAVVRCAIHPKMKLVVNVEE